MKTRKFYEVDLLNTKPRTLFGVRVPHEIKPGQEQFGHDSTPRFGGWAAIAKDQSGIAMIEYALICALIALGVLTGVTELGSGVSARWNGVDDQIGEAIGSPSDAGNDSPSGSGDGEAAGNPGNPGGGANGNGRGNGNGNGRGNGNGNGNGGGNGRP